jgi:hypothetical protein
LTQFVSRSPHFLLEAKLGALLSFGPDAQLDPSDAAERLLLLEAQAAFDDFLQSLCKSKDLQ